MAPFLLAAFPFPPPLFVSYIICSNSLLTSSDNKQELCERLVKDEDPQWPIADLEWDPPQRPAALLASESSAKLLVRSHSGAEIGAVSQDQELGKTAAARKHALHGMDISQGMVAQSALSHEGKLPMERFIAETYGAEEAVGKNSKHS